MPDGRHGPTLDPGRMSAAHGRAACLLTPWTASLYREDIICSTWNLLYGWLWCVGSAHECCVAAGRGLRFFLVVVSFFCRDLFRARDASRGGLRSIWNGVRFFPKLVSAESEFWFGRWMVYCDCG